MRLAVGDEVNAPPREPAAYEAEAREPAAYEAAAYE